MIVITLILFLCITGCAKKEVLNGVVGKPLHLSAILDSPEDTTGATFQWTFVSKPFESNLDILSFQPDSRLFNVYFIPDIQGEYIVQYTLYGPDGEIQDKNEFTCSVAPGDTSYVPTAMPEVTYLEEDTTAAMPTEPETTYAVAETEPAPKEEERIEPKQYEPPSSAVAPSPAPPSKPKVVKGKNIPKVSGKFTIQISSYQSYERAEKAVRMLQDLGLDIYIQRTFFSESNEHWYRIRTGTFDSYQDAKQALQDLQSVVPNENPWIDAVREEL